MPRPEVTDPDSEPGTGPVAARTGPLSLAVVSLARAHRALTAELFRELGLHPGQELILMYLWEHGPQRQTDLAAYVGTDSAAMTRTVQRLERSGFVRRRAGTDDRRVTLVEPTPASQALRPRVADAWARLETATAGALDGADLAAATGLLRTLERNVTEAALWATAPTPRPPAPSGPGRTPGPVPRDPPTGPTGRAR
ncbi:MAG TPA: MarR family transcriptional regulator [Promicromonospora sp.]|nr:MarR family transcriptional regulator [Promicromonospora sp.]